MSFKQHPEDLRVAKTPDGVPAPVNLDADGYLKIVGDKFPVAEGPDGTPTLLAVDSDGKLKVSADIEVPPITIPPIELPSVSLDASTSASGELLVDSITLTSLFQELIREVRKSNIYLSLLVGEEVLDSEV